MAKNNNRYVDFKKERENKKKKTIKDKEAKRIKTRSINSDRMKEM